MSYVASLPTGDRVYISNRGERTKITASLSNSSQQQSQSYTLSTGEWLVPPTLFQTRDGVVLRIEAVEGEFFLQLQYGSISVLATPPDLMNSEILPLHSSNEHESIHGSFEMPPMRPMTPMRPMPSLKMGNMKMEMGDMRMEMGKSGSSSLKPKFCPQCGTAVESGDRFCSQCGKPLDQ